MGEAYAVRRTVAPSVEIQAEINRLLAKGMVDDPQKLLGELCRLGARLIIQRAVEGEFDQWLGRARYERRPERQRGLRNSDSGLRNGFRPRHVQTAEGELRIEVPQARGSVVLFVSRLFSKWHCKRLLRTDPLKALVVGGLVRAGMRARTASRAASRSSTTSTLNPRSSSPTMVDSSVCWYGSVVKLSDAGVVLNVRPPLDAEDGLCSEEGGADVT
jgi:hypothetical protein